ncbi:hypothetical protein, partial [Actinomadura sp. 7K507]|uniref:hypothetical protein n=1 Tax=Actinomadura sp. 7K507 TaxID=2530365 RepID=UPI0014051FC3
DGGGGSAAPPKPPEGYTTYKGDVYSFAHPPGWVFRTSTDENDWPIVEGHPPNPANDGSGGQVIVSRVDGYDGSMKDMMVQARAVNQVNGRRVVSETAADVAGAREARRIETEYDTRFQGGLTVRIRSVDIYALTRNRTMLDLTVRGAQAKFDASGLPQVVSSFTVLG